VLSLLDDELQNDNVKLAPAFDSFANVTQLLRLCLDQTTQAEDWPRGLTDLVLKEMEFPDLVSAQAHLQDLKNSVRGLFLKTLGQVDRQTT